MYSQENHSTLLRWIFKLSYKPTIFLYCVMWNPSCFLIILLVIEFYQQATVLSRSINEGDSDTNGLEDFADSANYWRQDINSINVTTISSGFATNDPFKKRHPCRCGVLKESLGIAGGNDTGGYKYPWMAMIMFYNYFWCSGSLISNKYVLTAAHCVHYWKAEDFTVQLMRYNRSADEEHIDLNVVEIIIHVNYDSSTYANDIALLQLDTKDLDASLKSKMHPVCLPPAGEDFVGYNGIALGWGLTEKGVSSDVLREVSVPIISNKVCKRYIRRSIETDKDMCAGYKKGGKGVCLGDSGGPLLIKNNSTYYVVGVASYGSCGYLAFYARVNTYLDWLDKNTMDACFCSKQ